MMGSSSQKYIKAAMRWAWLVLLAALIAGSIAYYVGLRQPRSYETTTRLIVGPGITAINPGLNDMRAAAQLMWIYAEYATSDTVLQQIIDENHLPLSVDELRSKISVSPDQTTLWLTLRVRSKDQTEPVVLANALAKALIAMSPAGTGLPANQTKAYIGNQIQKVEQELTAADAKLADSEAGLDATKDPLVQRFYQDQISAQRVYATNLRDVLTTLYGLYQATTTNQITQVEAATDTYVVDLNTRLSALLAAFAGAIATLALVFAFVYFDDTIHTPKEVEDVLGLPLFGVIGKHKSRSRKQRSYSSSVKRKETYLVGGQQY